MAETKRDEFHDIKEADDFYFGGAAPAMSATSPCAEWGSSRYVRTESALPHPVLPCGRRGPEPERGTP